MFLLTQAFFKQWHVNELFAFINGVAASQGQLHVKQADSSTEMPLREWACSLQQSYQSILSCIR